MKTPTEMLNDIASEITENTSLLEIIFRISELTPEADNALACLIRSMMKTSQTAYEYVEQLGSQVNAESPEDKTMEFTDKHANQFNSWACDIGDCKLAVFSSMDDLPSDSNSIGVLSLVSQKLDELQEIMSSKADSINS
ncbi:hypothetical protein [Enterobacter asburiae]|uniref:hypothetical protein n=1 Tax=Enterobacter asburiae TaxID=61645 RepID=UPI00192C50EF|nr:hypothetical protein [Enterobacter asburiae]MBL5924739.1 hypothetical protein [Enterobacter asburiae]MBL5955526.1 hypothetical protein [Enterobacter asburiae]